MSESFSIIDKGVNVEGTISSIGKLVIKGSLKGTLTGETIVIGEEGTVHADLKAKHITVGGVFEGEIQAEEGLTVLATGACSGKIKCRDLVVEPGGILNAEVTSTALQPAVSSKNNPSKTANP